MVDLMTLSLFRSSCQVFTSASSLGLSMVDAPVSGGVPAAKSGSLTFLVGADRTRDFEMAEKVLRFMGKRIVHVGGAGSGQVAKVNDQNYLNGLSDM